MARRKHVALLGIAVMASGCAVGAPSGRGPSAERRVDPPPPPRGAVLLKAAMIAGHDAARAAAGVPPLAWDEALVASAQGYADQLARTGLYRHAVQPADGHPQGENLWAGVRGVYSYASMVELWIDERGDFVNGPTPAFSRSGDWHRVGHYTQIVWRGTTRFGCALASNVRDDYLVCRYSPAGNVMGRRTL